MLFLLFLFIKSNELCGGEELPTGYVCCNNHSCEYFCYSYDTTTEYNVHGYTLKKTTHNEICMTKHDYLYCYQAYPTILISFVCFMLPTLIAYLSSFIFKFSLSKVTFIFNVGSNISLALFVSSISCYNFMTPANISCIIFGSTGLLLLFIFERINVAKCCGLDQQAQRIAEKAERARQMRQIAEQCSCCTCCSCCCCCNPECQTYDEMEEQTCCCNCDTAEVWGELGSVTVSNSDLESIMTENALIPPTPEYQIIRYYNSTENGVQINQTEKHPITYGTWQENGKFHQDDRKAQITVYKCHQKYKFQDNMTETLNLTKQEAIGSRTQNIAMRVCHDTVGQTNEVIATDTKQNFVSCCTGCCVRGYIYNILMFFGYNGLIDACWRSIVKVITFYSNKEISADDSLRAKYNERDCNFDKIISI